MENPDVTVLRALRDWPMRIIDNRREETTSHCSTICTVNRIDPPRARRLLPGLLAALALAMASAAVQSQSATANAAVPIDHAAELPRLLSMAEQGHAVAQFNLGVIHDFGQGVPKDPQQALKWYRLAAAQGHGAAQFNLGGLYFEGVGVPRDLVRATMWFTLSAAAGVPGAAKNRSGVARMLNAADLARAQDLARACRQQGFRDCE